MYDPFWRQLLFEATLVVNPPNFEESREISLPSLVLFRKTVLLRFKRGEMFIQIWT